MSEPLVDATTPSNATTSILLDGELPRLGGSAPAPSATPDQAPPPPAPAAPAPTLAPPPSTASATTVPPTTTVRPAGPSPMLSAPGSAPVLGSPELPSLPSLPTAVKPPSPTPSPITADPVTTTVMAPDMTTSDLPTLPTVTAAVHQAVPATGDTAVPPSATPDEHPMAHLMPQKSAQSEASKRAAGIRAAKKAKGRKIKIGVAIVALAVAAIVGPPLGKWFVNAINESGGTSTEIEG
jgi:hypothetical protein